MIPSKNLVIICNCSCRFRGELFGLGNNHTKYKSSKSYNGGAMGSTSILQGASSSSIISAGGVSLGLYANTSSGGVHYGVTSQALGLHHSASGYMYEDQHGGDGGY